MRGQIPPWKIWNCDLQHCRNSESHPEAETTLIAKKDHAAPERLFFLHRKSPSEEFIPYWYCMPSYAVIFKDGKKISPCRTASLIPPPFDLRELNLKHTHEIIQNNNKKLTKYPTFWSTLNSSLVKLTCCYRKN